MDWKDQIDATRMPRHIAIIMDGNGRWARQHNRPRVFGHTNGVKAVREVTEAAVELGVQYLTLYTFSTENWSRPKLEVNALMSLLLDTLQTELENLVRNRIRLHAIGDISALPDRTRKMLEDVIRTTADNTQLDLILALNYSGRADIVQAVRNIGEDIRLGKVDPVQIDDQLFASYLSTRDIPDPELLIRTSGETRISNYLLWESAYTEFYFTNVLWPDFGKDELVKAIGDYQQRDRRFGGLSEEKAQ